MLGLLRSDTTLTLSLSQFSQEEKPHIRPRCKNAFSLHLGKKKTPEVSMSGCKIAQMRVSGESLPKGRKLHLEEQLKQRNPADSQCLHSKSNPSFMTES